MPVRDNSNNRILPANARATDVAKKAIQEILPVQQRRNFDAFAVQGYTALLYTKLDQGRKCTCQSSQKHINSRLGVDGKASQGTINQLLSGGLTFNVSPYGSDFKRDDPFSNVTSPAAPSNLNQGVFDIVAEDASDYPTARVPSGPDFGDNGPIDSAFDIESLAGDFDASVVGYTDAHCAVCFGHGFVGGYSPFHGNRQVITVADVALSASVIDYQAKPWSAEGPTFSFQALLPYGAIGVDTFRVMHNEKPVTANFTVDGLPADTVSVVARCDGKLHVIGVSLPLTQVWTHVEIQFVTSDQSAYFEFPKLTKGSDTAMLEQLEPFNILMSSNVPRLSPEDVIVESSFGKVLVVQNSNWWNTKNRDVLGWECQVRVIQPQEIFGVLPHRGRIMSKNQTSNLVHDNVTGARRT